jgi:hypothetical protein
MSPKGLGPELGFPYLKNLNQKLNQIAEKQNPPNLLTKKNKKYEKID